MSFGPAKGMDFASFCRVVKTMTLVAVVDGKRFVAPIPLRHFNVPIYNFTLEIR